MQTKQDPCIISRETASMKEKDIKRRLFGTAAYATPAQDNLPKTYGHTMGEDKARRTAIATKESTKMFNPAGQPTAGSNMQQREIKKMAKNQEQKMETFIDEMRQNFLQSQNANQVPQSLMYRQTQMMERQLDVLESNQK